MVAMPEHPIALTWRTPQRQTRRAYDGPGPALSIPAVAGGRMPIAVGKQCLEASPSIRTAVDHDRKRISGVVIAEAGDFRTPGRGSFDGDGLAEIARLINNAGGTESNFTHGGFFEDALGTYLGRVTRARLGTVRNRRGDVVQCVRGDLQLSEASFKSPKGNLGQYVLDLASEDPTAIAMSLRITPKEIDQRGASPLWWPLEIHGADVVAKGDATSALLSAEVPQRSGAFAAVANCGIFG